MCGESNNSPVNPLVWEVDKEKERMRVYLSQLVDMSQGQLRESRDVRTLGCIDAVVAELRMVLARDTEKLIPCYTLLPIFRLKVRVFIETVAQSDCGDIVDGTNCAHELWEVRTYSRLIRYRESCVS